MLTIILSSLISMSANAQAQSKSAQPVEQQQIINRNPQQRSVQQPKATNELSKSQEARVLAAEKFSAYKKSEGGRALSPMAKAPPKVDSNFSKVHGKANTGSHVMWGMVAGMGYCFEWTNTGDVLNGGDPIPNANCSEVIPSYFDWGFGQNGFGYCYEFTPDGYVLNEGEKSEENHCERVSPSYYTWDRAEDNGKTYCYKKTGNYDYLMNIGMPYDNDFCRKPKQQQQEETLQQLQGQKFSK